MTKTTITTYTVRWLILRLSRHPLSFHTLSRTFKNKPLGFFQVHTYVDLRFQYLISQLGLPGDHGVLIDSPLYCCRAPVASINNLRLSAAMEAENKRSNRMSSWLSHLSCTFTLTFRSSRCETYWRCRSLERYWQWPLSSILSHCVRYVRQFTRYNGNCVAC